MAEMLSRYGSTQWCSNCLGVPCARFGSATGASCKINKRDLGERCFNSPVTDRNDTVALISDLSLFEAS